MTRHEQVIEAMEHCVKVFRSMSERGAYPQELVPWNLSESMNTISPLFLGKQGYHFLLEAIRREKEEEAIRESRL